MKTATNPPLSSIVREHIARPSPIRQIMKMAERQNILAMGLDPAHVISFGGGWVNHAAPEETISRISGLPGQHKRVALRPSDHEPLLSERPLIRLIVSVVRCATRRKSVFWAGTARMRLICSRAHRHAMLDKVHERLDPGQPGVPGAWAVPRSGLQVFEELEHQWRINVLELQGRGSDPELVAREREQA